MSRADQDAYAGDVPVDEAFRMLEADAKALMVDVRTEPEWQYVGAPDLSGLNKDIVFLSWQIYPSMQIRPDYVERLSEELRKRGADETARVLFLCRSGVRSQHAAKLATEHGYTNCFNILEGFEGDKDNNGHRKNVNGWCKAGLPWLGA